MSTASILAQVTIKEWITMIGLIFGGCCSSVFTLEKVISTAPDSGNIITFFQFLFIASEGYIHFFDKTRPPFYIKKNEVPLKRWAWAIVLFFLTSVLNNAVFGLNISMPIHIIFRSSGTAIVMIIGWLAASKKYNKVQILSAFLLTIGAILAALYKDREITLIKRADVAVDDIVNQIETSGGLLSSISDDIIYLIGIGMLFLAAVLMAVMGLYNEETYRRYGKHWQENVFYCHLFGVPMFIFIWPKVQSEFLNLWHSPETYTVFGFTFSRQMFHLISNVLTQYICIRGVNMLAGNTTALTVSVVLLLRKFTSLLLSIILFHNKLSYTGCFGAFLVFFGAFLYSYGSTMKKVETPVLPIDNKSTEDILIKESVELDEFKTSEDSQTSEKKQELQV